MKADAIWTLNVPDVKAGTSQPWIARKGGDYYLTGGQYSFDGETWHDCPAEITFEEDQEIFVRFSAIDREEAP